MAFQSWPVTLRRAHSSDAQKSGERKSAAAPHLVIALARIAVNVPGKIPRTKAPGINRG